MYLRFTPENSKTVVRSNSKAIAEIRVAHDGTCTLTTKRALTLPETDAVAAFMSTAAD
jgi:hypothetical protein